MKALRLLRCGPWVSVQDLGRRGFQRYGISGSGAMDPVSLVIANRLASNPSGEAGLEIGRPGLTLKTVGAPVTVSAVGPSLRVWLDGSEVTGNRSLRLLPDRELRIVPGLNCVFAYLAVRGGFDLAPVFGSRSFHARSGIGGTGSGAMGDGAVILTHGLVAPELALREPLPSGPERIAVLPGPQIEHLEPQSWETFLEGEWKIGARSDRMGVRLEGPTLKHSARGYNIVSDGIVLGSVQLPGDGHPIVLAADRQTTGGYPKFAVIARADMFRFLQIPPGATVRFRSCTSEDAVMSLRQLGRRLEMLRLAPANRDLDSATLLSQNLIDGVVLG
jgi:biotin-dependent carboxylase-like uncharacterized protein